MTLSDYAHFCPHCLKPAPTTDCGNGEPDCDSCGKHVGHDQWLNAKQVQRRVDKRREVARRMEEELKTNPLFVRNDA